jgi:hypothetical protein
MHLSRHTIFEPSAARSREGERLGVMAAKTRLEDAPVRGLCGQEDGQASSSGPGWSR